MAKKPAQMRHKESTEVSMALAGLMASVQNGNLGHAIGGARGLLEKAPDDARVHDLLSTALALATNRELAAKHAKIALDLNPGDIGMARRAVSVLQRAGAYDIALGCVERALYRSGGDAMLEKIKINLLTDLGKHREAGRAIKKLRKPLSMKGGGGDGVEAFSIALLSARLVPAVFGAIEVIGELEGGVGDESLPGAMRKAGAFEMGRLLEMESDYGRAFESYCLGNSLNEMEWDPDIHSERVDRLIGAAAGIEAVPVAGYRHPEISGENMVFILGMMRSGSSLLEQIVAQFTGVVPGDEQPTLLQTVASIERELNPDEAASVLPMPVSMDRYTQEHIDRLAEAALTRYAAISAERPDVSEPMVFVTDKQTEHYVLVPLLGKIFPGCTIIHTTRDAVDTCWSNFTQSFAQGHPQSSRLDWIGRFHVDHDRMMRAWHGIAGLEIHEVEYGELVREPERETRRLAGLLGVEWTAGVLEFYKSKRTVATASQNQVRQPLYTSSVGRAARFGDRLDVLRSVLGLE